LQHTFTHTAYYRTSLSFFSVLLTLAFVEVCPGQNSNALSPLRKTADDDATKYTNIGNIGLTITNYGTIGSNFNTWPTQPSCEYPKGSRIEHLAIGGLWIGGILRHEGVPHVSTAWSDLENTKSGLITDAEITNDPGSQILQRSSLSGDQYFSLDAVSHQDLVMDFTDRYTRVPDTGDSIATHTPLNVDIHLESYAWNFPYADFFVALNYTIKNVGNDTIDGMYVGLWNDAVVRNTNLTGRPSGFTFYNGKAKGYIDSLRLGYTFDWDGSPYGPPANSYYGVKLLGADPFPLKQDSSGNVTDVPLDSIGDLHKDTYYNAWIYRGTGQDVYLSPQQDNDPGNRYLGKYQRLSQSMPKANIEALATPIGQSTSDPGTLGVAPSNTTDLLSTGPFPSLAPGDSINVVFAVVCAKKSGVGVAKDDYKNPSFRTILYNNAKWAQQTYQGEDINGNNKLDPGEDIFGDGILHHYVLPQPPRQPRVRTEVENQRAVIYWDRTQAEESFDPIRRKYTFEGYRVYRSAAGADIQDPSNFIFSMQLVGDYDRADDNIGYNTGFAAIKLDTPKIFPGDTVQYWYRFPPKNDNITSLNGWQYLYGISAYDQGDSANNLPSLECAKVIVRVVPGTPPTSDKNAEIGVYPNPYYAGASWDKPGERSRKIYFYNLPSHADIRIYTMTGDLVADIPHDASTYNGSGIKWFDDFSGVGVPAHFAGGEHAWDLISKYDQAIATGLYLFTVKDLDTGDIKRGKFVIVK
jgi:hypothetical protein